MSYQVTGDYTTWEVEHMHNKDMQYIHGTAYNTHA